MLTPSREARQTTRRLMAVHRAEGASAGCFDATFLIGLADSLHRGGDDLTPSLSVIVPVRNAEETLAAAVQSLLETLPDLTQRFEILIVDDASTDHTADVADELRRTYPQVRVVRHGWQWGMPAAVLTGRKHCRHDVVLVLPRHDDAGLRMLLGEWHVATRPLLAMHPAPDADSAPPRPGWNRAEPAHVVPELARQQPFLRHLRQLSATSGG